MKTNIKKMFLLLPVFLAWGYYALAQEAVKHASPKEISEKKIAVEKDLNNLKAHEAYIEAAGIHSPALEVQYKAWIKAHPKNANIPFAIGHAFADAELPQAKTYLLKAVALNPKNAEAWSDLSFDADRWGHEDLSLQYMEKAATTDPAEPSYGFYALYASKDVDPDGFTQKVLDFAKKFPAHERGAQAVFWLANDSKDTSDKIKYFELLKTLYPVKKFDWSASGMLPLYSIYLSTDAEKALALATEMEYDKDWVPRVQFAKAIVQLNALEQKGDYKAAYAFIDTVKMPKYATKNEFLILRKADLADKNGDTKSAYDSLVITYAKMPVADYMGPINMYGNKLGKNQQQIQDDIKITRESKAKPAAPFDLDQYLSNGKLSLAGLKGKVVLLTFWFPGCGPCRAEFPHFQHVINKYKDKNVVFVGINVDPTQNEYVLPFMQNTKYSFIPLHGTDTVAKAYGVWGEPSNYLIGPDGKTEYKDFRIDAENENSLDLMITSLLN